MHVLLQIYGGVAHIVIRWGCGTMQVWVCNLAAISWGYYKTSTEVSTQAVTTV
jgi:hypothetical protein